MQVLCLKWSIYSKYLVMNWHCHGMQRHFTLQTPSIPHKLLTPHLIDSVIVTPHAAFLLEAEYKARYDHYLEENPIGKLHLALHISLLDRMTSTLCIWCWTIAIERIAKPLYSLPMDKESIKPFCSLSKGGVLRTPCNCINNNRRSALTQV